MLKRGFDLAVVVLALPLWGPLLLVLIGIVWALDGRPVFFVQRRLGAHGRPFSVLKLRTMTCEEEVAARTVSRAGRLFRGRGLDEFPQLLCVLRGDMSLVGPRPLTAADHARLSSTHAGFGARLALKPGMTGLSQISHTQSAAETMALDAHYAETQGRMLDIAIILRTVWIHVVGKHKARISVERARGPAQ